jgi:Diaminopimelate epimerase
MIDFEKWHGNGNDFVIINTVEKNIKLTKSFIKKISDRNKGVGFDQLIAVGLPTKDDHDFFVRFYNSDSSEASMCLNGIRCASSYIWKK